MLFSLLYFLVRRLLGAGGRRPEEKDIELLVLRHQVKVLQRQVKRPRLTRLDRVLLAASRAMTRSSWFSFMVRPETLLRWHRELVRKKWTHRRTGHPGRPAIEPDVRDLHRAPRHGEPTLGYQRIRGELLKLETRISATTVRTILLRAGLDPAPRRAGPTWTQFLKVTGGGDPRDRLLHRRDDRTEDDLRPVLHRALDPPSARGRCQRAPDSTWVTQQTPEPRHRRAAFGCSVPPPRPGRHVLRTVRCAAPRRGRPRHSNADPRTSGERIRRAVPLRTVRQECLDHVLIYGRRDLERVLGAYVAHYVAERPHRGLRLAVPSGHRTPQARVTPRTPVERRDVLGGLIHEYRWAA
jgi:putative transposase